MSEKRPREMNKRELFNARLCFVCLKSIPEGAGNYFVELRILIHGSDPCHEDVWSRLKDYSKSKHGRVVSPNLVRKQILELRANE